MTHHDLCKETARRFLDKAALYEYKSFASAEEPDVLVYGYHGTTLFEIKMSRADFLADAKKDCRRKYKSHSWVEFVRKDGAFKRAWYQIKTLHPELFLVQAPHLGNERYFVCEYGLIQPEELPEGWGLFWFRGGKFYLKARSRRFRSNIKVEMDLLMHAMRRFASGDETGILVNGYGAGERKEKQA